jgi:aspartyl-tRNA(Asn)/glutamyl-tRNA(Gln) amidotransferase subunit A
MHEMKPLLALAAELDAGRATSRSLIEEALARIEDSAGEGSRTFIEVHREQARAAADASDRLRAAGIVPSPLAGLPISLKDLFDEAGSVTRAASPTRETAAAAARDSAVARRLRGAGAVLIGRTNLTEFAYSGLGINPHYGTPRNPWDREAGRIPGGSSAGAAVSVADGMAAAALGTDTGGSVRIPAALCGTTGLKTTHGCIPLEGCFPLSPTLDTAGPIGPTVTCCAVLDAVLRGVVPEVPAARPVDTLRLVVAEALVLDDLDAEVARCFDRALQKLAAAGARITRLRFAELAEIPKVSIHGGILGAEAWATHRKTVQSNGRLVDPRVRARFERGAQLSAADYIDILRVRTAIMRRANAATEPFDAVLMPTVACVAPKIEEVTASDDNYLRWNELVLRNTTLGNFLNRCALSIPIHEPGGAPVGLMLMGETDGDESLIRVGLGVEHSLASG